MPRIARFTGTRPIVLTITAILPLLLLSTTVQGDICRRQPIGLIIQRAGCSPHSLLAFGCSGSCTSYSTPSSESPYQLQQFCQCCDAIDYHNRLAVIQCWDGSSMYPRDIRVNMNLPRTCRCRPCSDTPENFVPADDFWSRGKRFLSLLTGGNGTRFSIGGNNDTDLMDLQRLSKPFIHIDDPDLTFSVRPLF